MTGLCFTSCFVHLSLGLTDNKTLLSVHMYRKSHSIYVGFGAPLGFRYPWGLLEHIPHGQVGMTVGSWKLTALGLNSICAASGYDTLI